MHTCSRHDVRKVSFWSKAGAGAWRCKAGGNSGQGPQQDVRIGCAWLFESGPGEAIRGFEHPCAAATLGSRFQFCDPDDGLSPREHACRLHTDIQKVGPWYRQSRSHPPALQLPEGHIRLRAAMGTVLTLALPEEPQLALASIGPLSGSACLGREEPC